MSAMPRKVKISRSFLRGTARRIGVVYVLGGIGKIAIYDEAEFLPPDVRRKIPAFLREWGKSAVMARLEYAKDQAELNKES